MATPMHTAARSEPAPAEPLKVAPERADRKAVYEAEYELSPKKFCAKAKALDFSAVRKGLELFDKPWKPCGQISAEG